jgi:agmatine deiminase
MHDYRREAVILDGGNVVASRTKVILTDKTYKENPSVERPRLRQRLEAVFQAECVFIPKEPYDVIGHADGVVRFISDDRVLINDYTLVDPGYGARLRRVLERAGLGVETLPLFQDQGGGRGHPVFNRRSRSTDTPKTPIVNGCTGRLLAGMSGRRNLAG